MLAKHVQEALRKLDKMERIVGYSESLPELDEKYSRVSASNRIDCAPAVKCLE